MSVFSTDIASSATELHLNAIKAAGIGCWELDLATLKVTADSVLARIFLLPESASFAGIPLDTCFAAVHSIDKPRIANECLSNLTSYDCDAAGVREMKFRLAGPAERWVVIKGAVTALKDGLPSRISGIAMEEKRFAEEVFRKPAVPSDPALSSGEDALDERDQLVLEQGRDRELLESIINSIPVMLTIYDPAVTHLRINREFTRVLGWTSIDSSQLDLFSACYPDPIEKERAFRFMNSLAPGWQDFRVTAKDGSLVETSWANIRLSDQRMVGIGIDVRERLATQRDLKEGEARLKLAVDSMELGTFDANVKTGRVEWSERARSILGLGPEEELTFEEPRNFIPPEDQPRVLAAIQSAIRSASDKGTGKFSLEHRIIRRDDGTERWISTSGRVLVDEAGQPVRYTGVQYDITGRKLSETALAEARARQEIVTHVVSRLLTTENPQEIIDDLAGLVMRKTGAEVYFNYLVERTPAGGGEPRLLLNSFASLEPGPTARSKWLDSKNSVCGRVASEGVCRIFTGIQESTDPLTAMLRQEGVRTYGCYPLSSPGGVLGALGFGSRTRDRFSAEDLALMQTVADHIAIAIERTLDRQALKESEARYKAIARHIPDGAILVVDPELRVVAVEGPLLERLGSAGLAGSFLTGKGEGQAVGVSEEHFRNALGGIPSAHEASYLGYYLRVNYVPLLNEEGYVFAAMALAFDITERKRADDALKESERRERARSAELEAVMDAVPAATWVAHDPECRVVYSNRLGLEVLKMAPGQNVSRNAMETEVPRHFRVLHEGREVGNRETPLYLAASTGQTVRDQELEILFHDGSSRYLFGSAVPLLTADGESNGAVAAFIDLTERKKVEEQLRQAQKMESIGVLAGGVAHDFNNLLTGVLGNATLAQLDAPPRILDKLIRITEAAEKAAGLTRQLLAYAGKGQFMITDVNLPQLIRSSSDLIRLSITKNIEVDMTGVVAELPSVRADAAQLQQIVMNLVINAAEAIGATQAGTVTITTGSLKVDPGATNVAGLAPGKHVYLQVRDTGCGMNDETKTKIFDPFFTTKFTGRGLGLAAVQGAVRALHGVIDVDSQTNLGSTFTVYLPVADSQAEKPSLPASTRTGGVKTATILVVDDEQLIRDIARLGLERFGHRVFVTSNGRQALEILDREPGIELVVLDVVMPVMGGVDALREIRARWPHMTVLLTSGYNREETRRLGTLPANVPFIQKPYTIQQLANAVDAALRI